VTLLRANGWSIIPSEPGAKGKLTHAQRLQNLQIAGDDDRRYSSQAASPHPAATSSLTARSVVDQSMDKPPLVIFATPEKILYSYLFTEHLARYPSNNYSNEPSVHKLHRANPRCNPLPGARTFLSAGSFEITHTPGLDSGLTLSVNLRFQRRTYLQFALRSAPALF